MCAFLVIRAPIILQFQEGFDVGHVRIIDRGGYVPVRIGLECHGVHHSFVKDQTVAFCSRRDVDVFCVGVTHEEIRVGHIDVTALVLRVLDLVEEILTNDVIVELTTSPNIEREPSDFATLFLSVSDVPVILRAS